MSAPIRVLVCDDQMLIRTGLVTIIGAQPGFEVVGECGDGRAAVDLAARLHPDVVVMDVRMPGTDGIEATRRIVASGNPVRVLILTTFDLDEYAFSGLRAGASGFLLKDVPPEELLAGIRAVAGGDAVVAPFVLTATAISRSPWCTSTAVRLPRACLRAFVSASWTTR